MRRGGLVAGGAVAASHPESCIARDREPGRVLPERPGSFTAGGADWTPRRVC